MRRPTVESTLPPLDPGPVRRALGDRFEIFEAVGSGASGTVFRARTRAPFGGVPAGAEVAVKVLRPNLGQDDDARRQLFREAALGSAIDDRHVVTIHGADEVEDPDVGTIAFLVTEFVHGRTLRDLLHDTGPAIGDLALRIGEQTALGLAALHEAGIVHRDVKPENVLITDDGAEIRLADLGLARPGDEAGPYGSSGGFHGSLAYAAPELLLGRAATPESDLYALGVVLFEIVTGRHPFAEDRAGGDAMLHAHLTRLPPRASHLQPRASAFLDAVIADLLEKDPARRPAGARAFANTLADAEASTYWRARERTAPVLASRRRLQAMRRSRHTPFFDRHDEQRALDQLLGFALDGAGRAVLVRGLGGSGRRRLVDECVDRWLGEHEGLVFVGGIAEDEPTTRLGAPFPQLLLDALLDGDRETSPRAVERLQARLEADGDLDAPEARALAEICAGDPRQVALSAAARADLLARGLAQLARRHLAIVVRVDRIHDADAVARLVIERLLEQVSSLPMLLILIGRPPSAAPFPGAELTVGPLPRAPFVELGRALFRTDEAPDDALFERAWTTFSGQPRSLQDSLEDLVAEGRVTGRPGDLHDLSAAVRDLRPARPALQQLRHRVSALPAAQRHVLQAAAVLGDPFEVADLAALAGRPELEVLESLGAFDNRIVAVERGRGRFRHRDYRLATIAGTPPEARRRLHRDAAWALEDRGAPALEIGLHLSRGLEDQACLDPLLDGLDDLLRQNARATAIRVSERLHLHLNRLPRSPENLRRRLRWLLSAGSALAAVDQEEKSSRAFRKAILIAHHLDRPRDRALAMVGLADLAQHKGRLMAAMQLLTQSEELLADADDPDSRRVRARALMVHARVMAYQGLSPDALRLANEALRDLPAGDDALEAHLRIDQARWLALRLRYNRAFASLDRAQQLSLRAGDPLGELRVHLHRGRFRGTLGDLRAAREDLEIAHAMSRRLGDERMRGRARLFRAELDAYCGDAAAARPALLEAIRAAGRARDRVTQNIAEALLRLGEQDDTAPRAVPFLGIPVVDLAWLLVEGVRRRRAGDADSADQLLAEAAAIERRARVHLLMRLAILRAAGRDEVASRLVRAVASRVAAGASRRRFVAYAERIRL